MISIDLDDVPQITGVRHLPLKSADAALLKDRYLGKAQAGLYLIRPDQHVAAHWDKADAQQIAEALKRARGMA